MSISAKKTHIGHLRVGYLAYICNLYTHLVYSVQAAFCLIAEQYYFRFLGRAVSIDFAVAMHCAEKRHRAILG